ncbi:Chloroperoxidase [Zychaea mexicana]|uniref:Chloroperoxidase n=1 Tax=Zychaea mexicana TaxID=64656 RepID=UPI0022FDF5CF|nr:Chloroperoxidase [Zychaea mexicana]KAI9496725.1 Chloroperoxidase [Zychaea mexicana]
MLSKNEMSSSASLGTRSYTTDSSTAASLAFPRTKPFNFWVKLGIAGVLAYLTIQMINIETHGRRLQTMNPEDWKKVMEGHPYQRPAPDASRGPCPAINTLANHGFINRDGRNVTQKQLYEGVVKLGMAPLAAHFISRLPYSMFKQHHPPDGPFSYFRSAKTIDLEQLGIHNTIEHDVSLSRSDVNLPPYSTIQLVPERLEQMIYIAAKRTNGEKGDQQQKQQVYILDKDVYDHRKLCWLESIRDNPYLLVGLNQQMAITAETAAVLDILGRNLAISEDHLRSFFLDEKIPADWHPPHDSSTLGMFKRLWESFQGVQKSKATLPRDNREGSD